MPKYLIHAGPGKTGTKYVQSSLFALRDALSKDGILYPANWWVERRDVYHHTLIDQIKQRHQPALERAFSELNSSDARIVLLSSEGFGSLSADDLTYFRSFLGESEAEVVLYCRRWSERIPSGWQQSIKSGSTVNFPEAYANILTNPQGNQFVNMARVLDRFADVFGKTNIKIVSFNNLIEEGIDLFNHFSAEILGWEYSGPNPKADRNESASSLDIELTRVLNALENTESLKYERHPFFRLSRMRPRLNLQPITDAMQGHVATMRVDDRAPSLNVLYSEMTQRYIENFIPPTGKRGIFRQRAREVEYVPSEYLLDRSVVDAVRGIHQAIRDNWQQMPEAEVRTRQEPKVPV